MRARFYRPEDLIEINEWYSLRQMTPMRADIIPKVGYIVEGVAAGFLYQTDSSMCLFDGFIANPLAERHEREEGLDKITDALISQAEKLNFYSIVAMTKHEVIRERCRKYHFAPKGEYHVYVRGVEWGS